MVTIKRLAINYTIPILIGVLLVTGVANGEQHSFSDKYSMKVDPAAKQQLGEEAFNEVMAFFHAAEKAIETKDLEALMDLYSENYRDGEHDKKSAEQIWSRIFSTFDTVATHHNMKLVSLSADKNTVILSCSGLLLGAPNTKKRLITVDNWTLQDHVLVKEAGKWKLIGTYGKDRNRLWFDKPMHPLF
jgi:ketosteroid isomerase-like protein